MFAVDTLFGRNSVTIVTGTLGTWPVARGSCLYRPASHEELFRAPLTHALLAQIEQCHVIGGVTYAYAT